MVDVLLRRAERQGDRCAYRFLADGEEEAESLTYRALEESSRALAVELRRHAPAGERALLLYPPGLAFIPAFLGCLRAGLVAVPASPPRPRRGDARLAACLGDARPRLALTTAALADRLRGQLAAVPEAADLRWIATDAVSQTAAGGRCPEPPEGEALAFLQYTSGTTSDPKGAEITHSHLAANEHAIQRAFGQSEESVVVGWLPLHHDMGLIGNVLQPLWSGGRAVLMAPLAFLQRPRRWLAAIGRYRATTAGGPDFAYALCARKIPAAERRGLDLSSWRVAFNGAEPVRADTLERFTEAFAPHGFRRQAFYPCYGLAEATLFVTGGMPEQPPVVRRPAAAASGGGPPETVRPLVSSGRAWPGEEVVIVDPEGRPLTAGRVGEIWVAGPSVGAGYWGRPRESRDTFAARLADGRGPYLRTGDLGLLDGDGELFVTGRLKDLIILRGRNVYPQDVEATAAASHPALRPDAAAAFSVEVDGEERLVVVCEIERRRERQAAAATAAVQRTAVEEHRAAPWAVVVIRAGTLPRTTSGKVRRGACREDFLAGRLVRVAADAAEGEAGAPQTAPAVSASEKHVLRSAAEVLEVAPTALDPAAALALDSLQAVELRNRLEADFAAVLPLELLLAGASPRRLAEELRRLCPAAPRPSPPRADGSAPAPGAGEPLSWGQRSLWFLERLAPEGSAYHLAFAARVRDAGGGAPSPAEIRRRFAASAARHPAFSTTFHEESGEPVQRPSASSGLDFAHVDAEGLDEQALRRRLAREARRPFDLRRDPLLRVRLFTAPGSAPVLLFVTHHIAADFWSLALVLEDLAAPSADAPALRPADHARWQRRQLAGPEGKRLWSYWRKRLAGGPPVLELPADFPRPPLSSHRGGAWNFVLDAAAEASARRLAAASGATLFTVLLAAFLALLHRLTGERDLVVGCPAAGRTRAGFEGVVGYFANLLPLRLAVDGAAPFRALLERARRAVVGALEHQDFPFPLLVERLAPPRDPARPPLAPVGFVLETPRRRARAGLGRFALGQTGAVLELGDWTLEALPAGDRPAHFDLILKLVDDGTEVAGCFEYAADLFAAATVERWASGFVRLLAAAAERPELPVDELPLLSAGERRRLLALGNGPTVPWHSGRLLHELVAQRAAEAPESAALTWGGAEVGGVLGYGELVERAHRLARRLRALGVGPEVPVALVLPRSPELIVSLLAVLAAGGAYLPVDPELPPRRRARLLAASGARVAVSRRRFWGEAVAGVREVLLDRDASAVAALGAAPPESGAAADHLAYVLFTSGSSGRPKGVGVCHRAVVHLMAETLRRCAPGPGSRVLQFAPPGFDASVLEIFMALTSGAALHLASEEARRSGLALAAELSSRAITHAVFIPSVLRLLPAGEYPQLEVIVAGGEALPGPLAGRWAGGRRLYNGYGPTEAAVYVTLHRCRARSRRPPAIGRPIANTRVRVLGPAMELSPPGVPGELYLGGPGLARGYLGQPGETAGRFVPDPFADVPGERLYRSGDRVRWRAGGTLEFLGRLDEQVKVRGFRVEPGEVEAALLEHPAVREAVVVARHQQLAAYLVAADGAAPPAAEEMSRFLAARLPEHMIPAAQVFLESLPVTGRGKLDRQALPPAWGPAAAGGNPGEERSELERTLIGVWCEVLGRERVGVDDNFFDLGGHSLAMARLQTRLAEIGRGVPLVDLFTHPTVATLAARLEAGEAAATEPEARPATAERRAAERRARLRRSRARYREVRTGAPT